MAALFLFLHTVLLPILCSGGKCLYSSYSFLSQERAHQVILHFFAHAQKNVKIICVQMVVEQQDAMQRSSKEYFDDFEVWRRIETKEDYERRLKSQLDLLIVGKNKQIKF